MSSDLKSPFNSTVHYVDPFILQFTDIACKVNLALMLVGIIGNVLCIYGFSKKKMRIRKFNWYLLILSIFELLFCIILSVDYLFRLFNKLPKFLHDLNTYTSIIIDFLIHTTDSYIILITLILSVDRLYAIKNPIKIKEFVTNLHSKNLVVISLSVLVVLKLPGVILCHQEWENNTLSIYCTFINPLIFNVIPCLVILILNIVLVFQIIFNQKRISNDVTTLVLSKNQIFGSSSLSCSSNSTVVLRNSFKISKVQKSHYFFIIAVSFWTFLTSIPYYSLNTYLFLYRLEVLGKNSNIFSIGICQVITAIFFNSNHCLNFFIYKLFHKDFTILKMKKPQHFTLNNYG